MNCLDYRRRRSAGEPPSDAAVTHLDSCTACREFERRSHQFDQVLRGALATSVPDGLADRVLFRRRGGFGWAAMKFAAAATVLLFITSATQPLWLRGLAPADAVLAHVLLDKPFEKLVQHHASPNLVKAALTQSGFNDLGGEHIRYLGVCPVPGGKGHHFIVTTAAGEASLVLIPDHAVKERLQSNHFGHHAIVLPARRGSYALVGKSMRELEAIEAVVRPRTLTSI